jgi:HAE1 family hydrophobic/amphiphilic exporter-1
MTTLTTVLGLVPLALGAGEGGEVQAPLGITVIFGLSMSTILTLIVVPVVYTWFEDLGSILTRRLPWLGANRAYGRSVE